ncbi:MAG: acyltransferase [Vitreimonas sp.]
MARDRPCGLPVLRQNGGVSGAASSERIAIIDAFRGIAIAAVMIYHYLVRWRPPENARDLVGYQTCFPQWLDFGRYGVDLFFVISGLVITMTLLRSRHALDFAVRRFARIYPAFVPAALLTFGAMALFGPAEMRTGPADLVASLFLVPEELHLQYVDGAYWSLAVELRFYVLTALFYFFFARRFWIALVAVAVVGQVIWNAHYHIAERALLVAYMPLFLIGIGGWLALMQRDRSGWICLAAGCFLYISGALVHPRVPPFDASFQWLRHTFVLGGAALMLLLMRVRPHWQLGPLAWLGAISYSLYLVHQNIGVTVIGALKRLAAPDLVAIMGGVAVTVLLAMVMYRCIEGPGKTWVMTAYRRFNATLASRRDQPAS